MPGSAPISIWPVTVEPSRISAGGRTSPTLTSKVPVTGSAWGATSRTWPIAWTFRLRVRKTSISGSGGALSMTCAGTSKTASRPSSRATRKTIWPACTTSPASAPRAVIVPALSAWSSAQLSRFLAMLSCACAASTRAWMVSRFWRASS